MDELFAQQSSSVEQSKDASRPLEEEAVRKNAPLADRMRPQSLAEYVGQQHILGEGKLLRRALRSGKFTSLLFSGPPGTGKTTLAELIAKSSGLEFVALSGVTSKVSEVRDVIEQAKQIQKLAAKGAKVQGVVLFIDEIHRFNTAQQDVLLPHVEKGLVRFIGATTHNPFHSINAALVSRSQLFVLEKLSEAELEEVLKRATEDKERGLGQENVELTTEAAAHLAKHAEGDARKVLTALELAALTTEKNQNGVVVVSKEIAAESIQRKAIAFDKQGNEHYNTISAFIKSIRGSDPDAALYWLAKMIEAGEDPRFIARRLVISASEDIGLADSSGLRVATDAFTAVEKIGLPEARICLAHATVYLATAPKSNRAYAAYEAAAKDVKNNAILAVPAHLQTQTSKKLLQQTGHLSKEQMQYQYAHDFEQGYVPQAYLPEGKRYYFPTQNGLEQRVAQRLDFWRKSFEEAQKNS